MPSTTGPDGARLRLRRKREAMWESREPSTTGPEAVPIYAKPRTVTDLGECWFYHTMDIPGYGLVAGQWDLRNGLDSYLGGIDYRGKRVLEVGTASGFVCFEMEKRGADVVACDLCDKHSWDVVPFALLDRGAKANHHRTLLRRLNNGYWLAHRAFKSKAKVVYTPVYDLPEAIGPVDIATLCCVMLHLRDPFQALAKTVRHARHTALIVNLMPPDLGLPPRVKTWRHKLARWLAPDLVDRALPAAYPQMTFIPDPEAGGPTDAWWGLSPELVSHWLRILGFEDLKITVHVQPFEGVSNYLYTIVAHRTKGVALGA
jgi:SAM-dependent methyltransferase